MAVRRLRSTAPRCARRYTCDCIPHLPVICDAPVTYSAKRDKPTITTPVCLRCGQAMKPTGGGSYQGLLSSMWETPVLRERVRAMYSAMLGRA